MARNLNIEEQATNCLVSVANASPAPSPRSSAGGVQKPGEFHGEKVRQGSAENGQGSHAQVQARQVEERQGWKERQEPQAGHRHRLVGSTQERGQGAEEEELQLEE